LKLEAFRSPSGLSEAKAVSRGERRLERPKRLKRLERRKRRRNDER
jgi:hypothetical protein